ncbi:GNAT family N-acetyltransferase [Mycetocola saprophilus]|uniref:GNAT family N-acetyltransferase n=1 Tax=Mycetocola saprophilus TaxID=76636 RepID=UPI0005BE6E37|nr:GNAT family N-acetyltransferase [Mycetocola saprophilus]
MDPTLTVRPFEAADAAPLTNLLHAAYAELGAMGLNYTAVNQDVETTRDRALSGQCWVVEQAGQIVGSLTISLPPSRGLRELTAVARERNRAWLNQVAVSPSVRGRGIAGHLWRLGLTWAAGRHAESIGVDTAIPADHLVRLYESWGFERVDTIHWPGKTYDSVVMTRPVTPKDT